MEFRLGGDSPIIGGPLCAGAQLLNVSRVGQEPALFEAEEDCRLLLGPDAENSEWWAVCTRTGLKVEGGAAGAKAATRTPPPPPAPITAPQSPRWPHGAGAPTSSAQPTARASTTPPTTC